MERVFEGRASISYKMICCRLLDCIGMLNLLPALTGILRNPFKSTRVKFEYKYFDLIKHTSALDTIRSREAAISDAAHAARGALSARRPRRSPHLHFISDSSISASNEFGPRVRVAGRLRRIYLSFTYLFCIS